jgi:opacity protein-like surface antigen
MIQCGEEKLRRTFINKNMNNSHKMTTVGATLLLAAASGHAQLTDKFYFAVDGGGAFQEDVAIRNNTGFNISPPSGDIRFNSGYRAGLDAGYNLSKSFAVELDASVIQNTINTVGQYQLSTYNANAKLDEIPLLANVIYRFPLKGPFKPYIGAGIGGMEGIFHSSNIPFSGPGATPTYDDTDYTFAYQAEAGFKYWLDENIAFGIAYKFVGTSDHTWTDNNVTLRTDGTMTQSIEATFTWRF